MSVAASWLSTYETGCTVVTATHRLARYLSQTHDQYQITAGAKVWETPDILPWDAWLQRQWSRITAEDKPLLLNDSQDQILWEQSIKTEIAKVGDDSVLWQLDKTARAARSAWRLMHDWVLKVPNTGLTDDHQAFQLWAKRFRKTCDESRFIDHTRLSGEIAARIDRESSPVCLVLVGFDQILPAQQRLLSTLKQQGCEIRFQPPVAIQEQSSECFECPDSDSEFLAAASWAREILESHPQASIGVVVPELQRYRARVERQFENVFYPSHTRLAHPKYEKSFHISLGLPLVSLPIIAAAFLLLRLMSQAKMSLLDLGVLLRSPFFGGAEQERVARATLDKHLRLNSGLRITWREVDTFLQKSVKDDAKCPLLTLQIARALKLHTRPSALHSPGEWARRFSAWLAYFSWPGERTLDSTEYQTVETWDQLLADFTALETIHSEVNLDSALNNLMQMAGRTFQPRENPAPIQILGVLEAGGMSFTHLWISDLHDAAWPAPIQPNPFLPIAAQRAAGVPQADIASAHEQSTRFFQRLSASAAVTVMSYPRTGGKASYGPSSLLESFPIHAAELRDRSLHSGYVNEFHRPELESICDHSGLPAISGVTGGTNLFADQSACPFRAYARHRLDASALDSPVQGLDAKQRGIAMHDLLRMVWTELRSYRRLCELSIDALHDLINDKAFAVLNRHASTRRSKRMMQLEIDRLTQRVLEWLEVERDRPPFEIEYLEQDSEGGIGGVTVKLRPDRVDRLEDGTLLIIDYKTGTVDSKNWFGERPKEPQLPLYRLLLGEHVQGIAYGSLKAGKVGYNGLASRDGIANNIVNVANAQKPLAIKKYTDWRALSESWDRVLNELSNQFCAGDARVDPRDDDACRLCDIRPVCRIDAISPMDYEEVA